MSTVFAERLKKERELNGFSQQEMARQLDISFYTYRNYEALGIRHREPNMDMIVKIATTLDTSADYLLGRDLANLN